MWANSSGRSPKMSDVSESLRSLTKNERCERIAQVAHQKWANEWIACFFERIAHSLIFLQKLSDSLRKQMSEFPALPYMALAARMRFYTIFKFENSVQCKLVFLGFMRTLDKIHNTRSFVGTAPGSSRNKRFYSDPKCSARPCFQHQRLTKMKTSYNL